MTEHTPEKVADLIAVALTWNPTECAASPVGAWHTIERLADALEAVSTERDEARKVIRDTLALGNRLPLSAERILSRYKTTKTEGER